MSSAELFARAWQHHQVNELPQAERLYRQILQTDPGHADAWCFLGAVRQAQGAIAEAEEFFRRSLELVPSYVTAHNCLGIVLALQERLGEAAASFEQALRCDPGNAEILNNLGEARRRQFRLDEATACCQEALRRKPDFPAAYTNLGIALVDQGRVSEGVACFREALRLQPDYDLAHRNLLWSLNYDPQADPDEVFAEHRRWGERHRSPVPPHTNDRSPDRRLRIGYVSPNLRTHPVARYLEPVLAHHDANAVEVFCYAEVWAPDAVTEELRSLAHGWRWTCNRSALQVAEQVRADGIDILVDLAGHSGGNRLDVFALKPAPIQATWFGYMNTTGLTTMDYRLTDTVLDPPGQPVRDTEQLLVLSRGMCCFAPPRDAPEVTPLPVRRAHRLTFGSLHSPFKLNSAIFDLWCRILHALPTSRLLLFRNTLTGSVKEHVRRQFLQRGIPDERLDLREGSAGPGYLRIYDEIDVSLDVFPHTGGVTTCESLWMGAPVLSLAGVRPAARHSATLLVRAGLNDWVVETPEQFVAAAVRAAQDLDRLAGVRAGLRDRLRSSLCDAARFTRVLEDAYRSVWRKWCGKHPAAARVAE